MKLSRRTLVAGTLGVVAAPLFRKSGSAQSVFSADDLGGPDGYSNLIAVGLNSQGLVLANGQKDGKWHAFVHRDDGWAEVGDPTAENFAAGVNEDGNVAGWTIGGANAGGVTGKRATLLAEGDSFDVVSTGFESQALGIGPLTFVVGQAQFDEGGPQRAAVWTPEGVTALDGPVAGTISAALSINADRQAGGWANLDDSGDVVHAIIWNLDTPTDLGVLGGDLSKVTSITNGGVAVGLTTTDASQTNLDADGVTAFIWDGSSMTALPSSDDQPWSAAYGVNTFGLVAGAARISGISASPAAIATPRATPLAANADTYAMVWGVKTAMIVDQVVEGSSGLHYSSAVAVNDMSQVLCNAIDSTGQQHIVVLSLLGT